MRMVLLQHCLAILPGMRGIEGKMARWTARSWANGCLLVCLYRWGWEKLGEKDMVDFDWQKTSPSNY